jgi:hypothetical protein
MAQLASCFDCIHLLDPANSELRNKAYFCEIYRKIMSYDLARTPNDCPFRESEDVSLANEVILDRLFGVCRDLVNRIRRPFTQRELFEYCHDYKNKNSLWELTESLVKEGRMVKQISSIRTYRGQNYRVNVYWPIIT